MKLLKSHGLHAEEIADVSRALDLLSQHMVEQRRKSGEPYITHPIEVARICFEELGSDINP